MGETKDEVVNDEVHEDKKESVDQLRADIEHTRAELSETIDALQEKLNPNALKAQAVEKVREAATQRVETLADGARGKAKRAFTWLEHNPWALGVGLFVVGALVTGLGRSDKREIE